mmetsp:Transcript_10847/g.23117  ORF Transcript_10847/g.23117 Transcript_10847/m.23117 type:complete len:448 (+) Transcript_10847:504-1847(+)
MRAKPFTVVHVLCHHLDVVPALQPPLLRDRQRFAVLLVAQAPRHHPVDEREQQLARKHRLARLKLELPLLHQQLNLVAPPCRHNLVPKRALLLARTNCRFLQRNPLKLRNRLHNPIVANPRRRRNPPRLRLESVASLAAPRGTIGRERHDNLRVRQQLRVRDRNRKARPAFFVQAPVPRRNRAHALRVPKHLHAALLPQMRPAINPHRVQNILAQSHLEHRQIVRLRVLQQSQRDSHMRAETGAFVHEREMLEHCALAPERLKVRNRRRRSFWHVAEAKPACPIEQHCDQLARVHVARRALKNIQLLLLQVPANPRPFQRHQRVLRHHKRRRRRNVRQLLQIRASKPVALCIRRRQVVFLAFPAFLTSRFAGGVHFRCHSSSVSILARAFREQGRSYLHILSAFARAFFNRDGRTNTSFHKRLIIRLDDLINSNHAVALHRGGWFFV